MSGGIWDCLKKGESPPGWGWLNRFRIVLVPSWSEQLRANKLDTIKGVVRFPLGEVISTDRKQEENEVKRLEVESAGQTHVFFIKRYYNHRLWKIWRRAFRGSWWPPSMVKTEYMNLRRLSRWGFHVPEPAAYGEHRFGGGLINAFLISLEIPEAMGLDYLLHDHLPELAPETQRTIRRDLIAHLAELVGRMHGSGFEHHDLFLRNLMVSGMDFSRIYLLDAPRGKRWPQWIARFRSGQDLATLDSAAPALFRKTERLRFFLLYRGHDKLTEKDKRWIRKILETARPWRDRQIRRLGRSRHVQPNP